MRSLSSYSTATSNDCSLFVLTLLHQLCGARKRASVLIQMRNRVRTLGEMARAKMALVAVCRRCQHRKVLYLPRLIERFGENMPSIGIRKHLRCSNCRYTRANLHESAR